MKKTVVSIVMCAICTCSAFAATRGSDAVLRGTNNVQNNRNSGNISSRVATTTNVAPRAVLSRNVGTRTRDVVAGTARSAQTRTIKSARTATSNVSTRGAIISKVNSARPSRSAVKKSTARAGMLNVDIFNTNKSNVSVFDADYEKCQTAYFTCMDQFCALQNESYRRCICSSKLETVKSRERALSQTSTQLQDFKDLNIDAILKTPAEVKAMLSATEGEVKLSQSRDKSQSMKKLTAISSVLESTRQNAMSTSGQLDVGGDIKQIWNTTDLISGANIANLTGESLYNAVHSQCAELVKEQCSSDKALSMVMSAYGMYIENDCATILAALDKQANNANTAIRQTNREMMTARLENYDSHNSAAINECIAGVRENLTADTACGTDYVHCLDLTGRFLNKNTGEPIYTANFYELNNQVSLSGDVLTNATNAKLVNELNRKKEFAKKTLETCRDIADQVWEEFLRQAITEIYQGQQSKIRQVKNECMDIVNKCYDETTAQLRDYSNIEEQMLLGARLELSEEMCAEKMATCSNLYGGGSTGLQLLIEEMHKITNQKISQNCFDTLKEYAQKLCRVPGSDTLHGYPYGCRVYTPGDIFYATHPECTYIHDPTYSGGDLERPADAELEIIGVNTSGMENRICWDNRIYRNCNDNYFLWRGKCYNCPEGYVCRDNIARPVSWAGCGNYIGSLYQKMVIYALQYCVRPSEANDTIPSEVLGDVNMLMDTVRSDMASVLAEDCERYGGEWVRDFAKANEETCEPAEGIEKNMTFYNETNANLCWGLCKKKATEENGDEP